jgi:hypothetical protein
MCFLLSHWGITNAVYHASHFSGMFMPPSACSTGLDGHQALSINLESGSLSQPQVMGDLLGTPEAEYFAVAWVPIRPNPDNYVALFFEEDCATQSFFIAAFPSNAYPLSQSF